MSLQQLGNVYFQLFISLNGLISLCQSAAKIKTRFSNWGRKKTHRDTVFSSNSSFSAPQCLNEWFSFLSFPMYLIKHINYMKGNKSDSLHWREQKGKPDRVVNILEHNLSTELVTARLSHYGNNSKFLQRFHSVSNSQQERLSAWCLLLRNCDPQSLLLFSSGTEFKS